MQIIVFGFQRSAKERLIELAEYTGVIFEEGEVAAKRPSFPDSHHSFKDGHFKSFSSIGSRNRNCFDTLLRMEEM